MESVSKITTFGLKTIVKYGLDFIYFLNPSMQKFFFPYFIKVKICAQNYRFSYKNHLLAWGYLKKIIIDHDKT